MIPGEMLLRYNAERCGDLALALYAVTGWELVAIADVALEEPKDFGYLHVAVREPASGKILDVNGLRSEEVMLEDWWDLADAYAHDEEDERDGELDIRPIDFRRLWRDGWHVTAEAYGVAWMLVDEAVSA